MSMTMREYWDRHWARSDEPEARADATRVLRDHLRVAIEAANLAGKHADQRGAYGHVFEALRLVDPDGLERFLESGEWEPYGN